MAASKKNANKTKKLPEDLSLNSDQQKEFNKEIEIVKSKGTDGPGVVYVGHIPHGFFEPQMQQYFRQFGRINKLRMSRSKKSGRSKGYAFVEFASHGVAEVVAESMNNYLMFHRLLKCKLMEEDKMHPELFKNWNRHFKRPRGHLNNKERHNRLQSDDALKKSNKRMQTKNRKRIKKLQSLGISLELPDAWISAGKKKSKDVFDVGDDDDDDDNDDADEDDDKPTKRRKLTHTTPSDAKTTQKKKHDVPKDEVKGKKRKVSISQDPADKTKAQADVKSVKKSKKDNVNTKGGNQMEIKSPSRKTSASKVTKPESGLKKEKSGKKTKTPEKFKKSAKGSKGDVKRKTPKK